MRASRCEERQYWHHEAHAKVQNHLATGEDGDYVGDEVPAHKHSKSIMRHETMQVDRAESP